MDSVQALRVYTQRLRALGVEDAQAEARHALSALLGVEIHALFVQNPVLTEDICAQMERLVRRRAEGEPLAYILGERWFMGLRFFVDARVLIPRLDTELLAERAIQAVRARGAEARALDLCTGSGCVAVSVAKYAPCRMHASDVSAEALAVAGRNARTHGVEVALHEADLTEGIVGPFDVVTANPPYVAEEEYAGLQREVRREPRLALVAEEQGLAMYRRLARTVGRVLAPGAVLLMEIGAGQGADVASLFECNGYDVAVHRDLAGRDRVVEAIRHV